MSNYRGEVSIASGLGSGGYLGEVSIVGGIPAGEITGLVDGAVLYGAADGSIAQDLDLFWNDTAKELGIVGDLFVNNIFVDQDVSIGDDLEVVGDLTLIGRTQGHVLFIGAAGLVTNESNLFWDATNNRLGINDNTPSQALDVTGNIAATGTIFAQNSVQIGPNGGIDRIGSMLNIGESSAGAQVRSSSVRLRSTGLIDIAGASGLTVYGDELVNIAAQFNGSRTRFKGNAILSDNMEPEADAVRNLVLTNQSTGPAASPNAVHLFGVDSAGATCTLGVVCEQQLVAEAVAVTDTLIVEVNGVFKKLLFGTV